MLGLWPWEVSALLLLPTWPRGEEEQVCAVARPRIRCGTGRDTHCLGLR